MRLTVKKVDGKARVVSRLTKSETALLEKARDLFEEVELLLPKEATKEFMPNDDCDPSIVISGINQVVKGIGWLPPEKAKV